MTGLKYHFGLPGVAAVKETFDQMAIIPTLGVPIAIVQTATIA
ncbi:MAG: hypothetical protein ACRD97_07470 [Nitrososphaeraceae archaeon]|jgi:hypothetical protein